MATKKVLVTIKRASKERKKSRVGWGVGVGKHIVVIERFLVEFLVTIWWHQLNSVAIGQWLCILILTNGYANKFGCHLGIVKWQSNLEEVISALQW